MKKITDRNIINSLKNKYGLDTIFSSHSVEMELWEYEKGEFISSPFKTENYLKIVIEGSVSVYAISDDGNQFSLTRSNGLFLIGDVEFCGLNSNPYYAEVLCPLKCICININMYSDQLKRDSQFLYYLSASLAKKLAQIALIDTTAATLEKRVMNHLNYHCEDHLLCGIEKNAFLLHCSSRQLQRILNRFEENGIVKKCGKGKYRLLSASALSALDSE